MYSELHKKDKFQISKKHMFIPGHGNANIINYFLSFNTCLSGIICLYNYSRFRSIFFIREQNYFFCVKNDNLSMPVNRMSINKKNIPHELLTV